MKKNFIFISLIIIFQNACSGQTEKGIAYKDQVKENCQLIVDDFTNGKLNSAFDQLEKIWVLPKKEIDKLEKQTIDQLSFVESRFGSIIGNKFVQEKIIEDLLYQLTYVVKLENHAIRLNFVFYNGKGGLWYLNKFTWDDDLSKLLEDR